MSSAPRRRLVAAALAASAAMTLGGCGTSFNAQTNKVYQAAVGANHRGEVSVLNTLLVANSDGSATLSAGVLNNGPGAQTLTGVAVTSFDDKPLTVTPAKSQLALPAGVLTTLGGPSGEGNFLVTKDAVAGAYVKLTLTFSDAAEVTIEAPVVARTATYDDVTSGRAAAKAAAAE